jgi:hypothetical protein
MAFKHACFISYCHGQNELINDFIEQLCRALKNYLEPYLDEGIYLDSERLKPGYQYNEALARAICESVCMIVVYSPRYENHSYCRREFAAMERIQEKRKQLLGAKAHGRGFIIPVILTGDVDDLPPRIKESIHCCDFSRFTLASADISRNPDFIPSIQDICKYIYQLRQALEPFYRDLEAMVDCSSYQIPPEGEIPPWRPVAVSGVPFPGWELNQ